MGEITRGWEQATKIYPVKTRGVDGRKITLRSNGQLNFSRFFNILIEKSEENPLGDYKFLGFRLGFAGKGNIPILYIKFNNKKELSSLEIKSNYPQNVVGIKSVLSALNSEGVDTLQLCPSKKYVWKNGALTVDPSNKICSLRITPDFVPINEKEMLK